MNNVEMSSSMIQMGFKLMCLYNTLDKLLTYLGTVWCYLSRVLTNINSAHRKLSEHQRKQRQSASFRPRHATLLQGRQAALLVETDKYSS